MSDDADRVRRRMSISDLIYHSSTDNEQDTSDVHRSASHTVRFRCEKCNRGFTRRTDFLQHRTEVSTPLIHIIVALKRIVKTRVQATRQKPYR